MIVSFTIVRYHKAMIPFALLAMAVHRLPLILQRGCTFWKLLGSGRNGTFDLQPDWQQWGLLAVWDDKETFGKFYENSFITHWWEVFCFEKWTVLLEPLQSHGKWDNKQPFDSPNTADYTGPIAILTRATIRFSRIKAFWNNVDSVAGIMANAPGYITSFGVGEAPVYRQATFSVWKSVEDVKAFAYASKEHSDVIKKTRDERWYSEELFARFKPVASFGTVHGENPLINIIK